MIRNPFKKTQVIDPAENQSRFEVERAYTIDDFRFVVSLVQYDERGNRKELGGLHHDTALELAKWLAFEATEAKEINRLMAKS